MQRKRSRPARRVLYLSSPIGLGHARRDLAITRELRRLIPDLQVDWLAQDPVTRFLAANDETVHPDSARLVSESTHIEAESGEHDLNAFMAIRNMDEILIKNFMVFQEAVEQTDYDLVIADEAWDVDHYWHEHPELKKTQVAWFTDFVGWVPIPENGAHEAHLTTDYNAEMIGHVENHPTVRDRAIFVGNPDDIIPHSFGEGLPQMRDWVPKHYDFSGYIIGQHPDSFGSRAELRQRFGYRDGERICIVTVGGSGVGGNLIRRILAAWPAARARIPELRMIVVTGPRLDPARFELPAGVEARAFVPDLDRHLAACDLALVQGGLTTCMELAAAGTPFLYFPLKNHFEQNFHVARRLDRYNAGRKMIYDESDPDTIAQAMVEELSAPRAFHPVEADGAARAVRTLSELFLARPNRKPGGSAHPLPDALRAPVGQLGDAVQPGKLVQPDPAPDGARQDRIAAAIHLPQVQFALETRLAQDGPQQRHDAGFHEKVNFEAGNGGADLYRRAGLNQQPVFVVFRRLIGKAKLDDDAPPRQGVRIDVVAHVPHQVRSAGRAKRRLGIDAALGPLRQHGQGRLERDGHFGSGIVDRAGRRIGYPLDKPLLFQLLQPLGQERRGNAADLAPDFVEFRRPGPEPHQNRDRPSWFQQLAGAGDRADHSVGLVFQERVLLAVRA